MLLAAEEAVDAGVRIMRSGRSHIGAVVAKGDRDFAAAVDFRIESVIKAGSGSTWLAIRGSDGGPFAAIDHLYPRPSAATADPQLDRALAVQEGIVDEFGNGGLQIGKLICRGGGEVTLEEPPSDRAAAGAPEDPRSSNG